MSNSGFMGEMMTLRDGPRVPREKGWCNLAEKEIWPLRRNSWSAEIASFISFI